MKSKPGRSKTLMEVFAPLPTAAVPLSLLVFDLGANTGWAARGADGILTSGVKHFPLVRGDSQGMRFLRFKSWLLEMLHLTRANVIAFESAIAFHKSMYAGQLANGLAGIMQVVVAEAHLECLAITPSELKRFATGKGNAKKDKMVEAARKLYPDVKIESDDEADALLALSFAEHILKTPGKL